MIYREFKGKKLSALGFGCMRLPTKGDAVDVEQVEAMTAYAIEHGVNYFDTAYPYHVGMSERVMGQILSRYPRESFYLADKFPGHQVMKDYHPQEIFEEQLRRCKVDYFDFYLLHNVYEKSLDTYLNPEYGILDYFREQKRLGRIKHLGFSTHAQLSTLEKILDIMGDDMEFCQIQLNYLDWTLQDAKGKYKLLSDRNIPIWVMEPVRGGKLASLTPEQEAQLKALRPKETIPAWCFRFLQRLPNLRMILSGMSNMDQVRDNIRTFSEAKPLTDAETDVLFSIAETMKNGVPCTGCRYCCDGCPAGLDIPTLLETYNELKVSPSANISIRIEFAPEEKRPSACIDCGQCVQMCPQNIDIPKAFREMTEIVSTIPSWAETCRKREEAKKQK